MKKVILYSAFISFCTSLVYLQYDWLFRMANPNNLILFFSIQLAQGALNYYVWGLLGYVISESKKIKSNFKPAIVSYIVFYGLIFILGVLYAGGKNPLPQEYWFPLIVGFIFSFIWFFIIYQIGAYIRWRKTDVKENLPQTK